MNTTKTWGPPSGPPCRELVEFFRSRILTVGAGGSDPDEILHIYESRFGAEASGLILIDGAGDVEDVRDLAATSRAAWIATHEGSETFPGLELAFNPAGSPGKTRLAVLEGGVRQGPPVCLRFEEKSGAIVGKFRWELTEEELGVLA